MPLNRRVPPGNLLSALVGDEQFDAPRGNEAFDAPPGKLLSALMNDEEFAAPRGNEPFDAPPGRGPEPTMPPVTSPGDPGGFFSGPGTDPGYFTPKVPPTFGEPQPDPEPVGPPVMGPPDDGMDIRRLLRRSSVGRPGGLPHPRRPMPDAMGF